MLLRVQKSIFSNINIEKHLKTHANVQAEQIELALFIRRLLLHNPNGDAAIVHITGQRSRKRKIIISSH